MTTELSDIDITIRDGDQEAFSAVVDIPRRELQVHCYRMPGSVQDSEDVVQTFREERRLLARYMEATERADMATVAALLRVVDEETSEIIAFPGTVFDSLGLPVRL